MKSRLVLLLSFALIVAGFGCMFKAERGWQVLGLLMVVVGSILLPLNVK